MDQRTSDASWVTARRANFRERIMQRDGVCVVTGELAEHFTACHIIPHSKGNDYIVHALGPDNANECDGIDGIRNGLLGEFLHRPFGNSLLAFLKTPTLYLSVDDIPYNQPRQENPANRITLHHIVDSRVGVSVHALAPNNVDLREPADTSEWSPAIIVNMAYISAALQAWAPVSFKETIRAISKDSYYDTSPHSSDSDGEINPHTSPAINVDRQLRLDARNTRALAGYPQQTELSSMMDGLLALRMKSAGQGKGNHQTTTETESELNDRVEMWLDSSSRVFNPGH